MRKKDFLFLAISSFILSVIWIASNVYHAYATSTIAPDLQLQITPISPDFDTETLRKLKSRKKVTSVTLIEQIPTPNPSEAPPPEVTVQKTPTPLPNSTPTP